MNSSTEESAVLLGGELEVRALRALVIGPEPGSCLVGVGIVVPDGDFHQAGVQRGMGGARNRPLDPPYPLLELSGRQDIRVEPDKQRGICWADVGDAVNLVRGEQGCHGVGPEVRGKAHGLVDFHEEELVPAPGISCGSPGGWIGHAAPPSSSGVVSKNFE